MAFNLLDSVRSMLTPDLINQASSHLGESSSGITKAVSAGVPAVLAGIINKAESGDAGSLLNQAKEAANSNIFSNLGSMFGGGTTGTAASTITPGTSLLGSLFGGGHNMISDAISNFAGIKNSSVTSLLSMLAPLALGVIGRHATTNNLSASGLTSLLSSQKSAVTSAMPSGLNLGNLLNIGGTRATETAHDFANRAKEVVTPDRPGGNRLLPWIIGLVVLGLLLYFLSRGCNHTTDNAANTQDTTRAATPMMSKDTATVSTTRESMKVKLADGTEIDAYKGGIEDKLVQCLNDASCQPGKEKWFDFDNINFEMASAKLTPESQKQIGNIVAILKAYPKTKVKVGGYTDKTGDDAVNKKLSKERAETVANALKSSGGQSGQITGAEGYGSQFAKVAATASDEERKTDRRIALQLNAK